MYSGLGNQHEKTWRYGRLRDVWMTPSSPVFPDPQVVGAVRRQGRGEQEPEDSRPRRAITLQAQTHKMS